MPDPGEKILHIIFPLIFIRVIPLPRIPFLANTRISITYISPTFHLNHISQMA